MLDWPHRSDLEPAIDPGDYRLSDIGPEPGEQAADQAVGEPPPEFTIQVRRGDTLIDLLLSAGVSRAEAHEAIVALKGVFDPRDLKPGHEITLTFAPAGDGELGQLMAANVAAAVDRDVNLSRDSDGRFTALERRKQLARDLVRATGSVRSSLFEAGSAAGVPGPIMVEMIRAFSYDVDFQRDVQPGDAFEVMFERYHDEQGRFAKDGLVLYGKLTLSGREHFVYRHATRDGTIDYYNDRGESVRKALLRTPIDGARLTSRFGNRMHPILGFTAVHKGVDFGAPPGTPIQAAGDGIVEQAGWFGGYGNFVRIRHGAEYATAYAHMSRYAGGIRPGQRVRQGQVVGYVGMTGQSTGPHLHYEVIRRGAQINPVNVMLPAGRKLEGSDLARFREARADMNLQVANVAPVTRVARMQAAQ
jgi:murein DD-endopeptidase MepM/ murein hydrolase activator NlpD